MDASAVDLGLLLSFLSPARALPAASADVAAMALVVGWVRGAETSSLVVEESALPSAWVVVVVVLGGWTRSGLRGRVAIRL